MKNKIRVELDDIARKNLVSLVNKKMQIIVVRNLGILDVSENEVISEVINDLLVRYGSDYLAKLQEEYNESRIEYGYSASYDKDKVRKLLGLDNKK